MTTEQHGSKTGGDDLARQERMAECRFCKTAPGNGDAACRTRDDALQCIWLRGAERAHQIERQLRYLESCNQHLRQKEISELRSELSRLGNEGGGEEAGDTAWNDSGLFDGTMPAAADGSTSNPTGDENPSDVPAAVRHPSKRDYAMMLARIVRRTEKALSLETTIKQARGLLARGGDDIFSPLRSGSECDSSGAASPSHLPAREAEVEKAFDIEGCSWGNTAARMSLYRNLLALTTTSSRGLVEAAEWQPIETAPKDTLILVCWGEHGGPPIISRWLPTAQRWTHPFSVEPNPPTHWMPLPAPPRTLSAKPTATAADREGDRDA